MNIKVSIAIAPLLLTLAAPAWAEPQDEASALFDQIARSAEALNVANCALACQALASMQRATERLCALDPGPRCADAKTKVKAAEEKVRAACPDCAAAQIKPDTPADAGLPRGPRKGGKKGDFDEKPASPQDDMAKQPSAPPPSPVAQESVIKGGGCAGCEVGASGERGILGASLLMGLWAVSRWRRRGKPR